MTDSAKKLNNDPAIFHDFKAEMDQIVVNQSEIIDDSSDDGDLNVRKEYPADADNGLSYTRMIK